jgi:hypothetical protein
MADQEGREEPIVTASAAEALSEGKDGQPSRAPRGTRKLRTSPADSGQVQRFFLAKAGGSGAVPELGKEVPGEPEAMVESLKTGLTYFVVSEWRGVADFSGKKPQLGREAARSAPKAG